MALLGLLVVGLGLSDYLPLPSPVLALRPPGGLSGLELSLTPARQVSLVVALLACAVVDGTMRDHSRPASAGLAQTAPFWVLPGLTILVAFALFEGLAGPLLKVLGMAGAALSVILIVTAQLHTLDLRDPWFGLARLGLNTVAYAVAFVIYLLAQTLPSRGAAATPLVAASSALVAAQLLASPRSSARRTWGTAALVGLMMAEVAWALSPGVVTPLVAGFVLLLVFYGLTGVLQQHLWGRLERRVVVEFFVVAALAFALLLKLAV